ncbi:hypothetical protein HYQ44_015388 [Verticillium longisporum]|nr:hypothetical protein HYQ44_015388 [Verticillium longisporum]
MEKFSQFRDKGSGISPFMPIKTPVSPLTYALHTSLFLLRLPLFLTLTATYFLFLHHLPLPVVVRKALLWSLMAIPGLWWIDLQLDGLRAAAPQTRDQRDRRRKARLKDRHQVRVASGQKIPDLNEIPEVEAALQTKEAVIDEEGSVVSPGLSSPREGGEDDVAARAALLLQGMRGGRRQRKRGR